MLRKISYFLFAVLAVTLTFVLLLKVNFSREIIKNVYYLGFKEVLKYNFSSCVQNNLQTTSFSEIIIAGHTYGETDHKNTATYPKFLEALKMNVEYKIDENNFSKIILAGDIVRKAKEKNFLEVKKKLSNFSTEILVAPGNHDFGPKIETDKKHRNDFLKVFKKSYTSLDYKNNLFLILDTASITGSFSSVQIGWIQKEINKKKDWNNIFIITHHVVWSDMMNQLGHEINPNLSEVKTNNFNDLYSILKKVNKKINIHLFAGDINVAPTHTKLFCEKKKNIYFIATGMGNGRLDNFISLKVSDDGKKLNIKPIFF